MSESGSSLEIFLDEKPSIKGPLGYSRGYQVATRFGELIFKFHGERDDRLFYVEAQTYGRVTTESNVVNFDTVADALAFMADDADVVWFLSQPEAQHLELNQQAS